MSRQDEAANLARFQALNEGIEDALDARVDAHQADVAQGMALAAAGGAPPLNLVADGDSWFDYTLGGDFPGDHTDVLAQLRAIGQPQPRILSLAHYGDTTRVELGLTRRRRLVKALSDPRNGKVDAILMSGGGNDIVADALPIWLNRSSAVGGDPAKGLSEERFAGALAGVRAGYESLAELRDLHAPGTPIFVHAYDFAIPNGVGVYCIGPWLKPGLEYAGWTDLKGGTVIIHTMLARFGAMLQSFAAATPDVVFVDTQGTLAANQWANELHPDPAGFKLIAAKFRKALAARFPGRV